MITIAPEKRAAPQRGTTPTLKWVNGKIRQILLQDKERFYIVTVVDGDKTYTARFGDPYTGKSDALSADNPMYSLIEKAFFHNQDVSLGIRDFGFDTQAGIEKLIIDRVSIAHP